MNRLHLLTLAIGVVGSLGACGDSQISADGSDGAAVAACRDVLAQVSKPERLATTVREEGSDYTVSAWRDGRAEGKPDYLCQVARDENAERGVAVVKLQARDGAGGYRSTLDIEFDTEK